MTRLAATLRALPVTFVIYLLEAALALLIALPLGLELLDDARPSLSSALGRAALFDQLAALQSTLHVWSRGALLHAGLLVLLAPWLQMAWLFALSQPSGVRRALAEGFQRYLRAWLITLWVAVLLALASIPSLVSIGLVEHLLAEGDARLHDAVMAAVCLPLLLLFWWAHVLHDLARARALTRGSWAAVRASLGDSFRPRAQLPALLLAGLSLSLHGGAWWLVQQGTLAGRLPTLSLMQLSCLLTLILRSAWLACALACAEHDPTY